MHATVSKSKYHMAVNNVWLAFCHGAMETSELKYGSKVVASCWNDWLLFNIVYEKPITAIEIHEHDSDDCAVSHLGKANLLVILYPYRDGREEMTAYFE